jgi:hypothetical protein
LQRSASRSCDIGWVNVQDSDRTAKGSQEPPLRSLCGSAYQEQPGTRENNLPRAPAFSRVSRMFSAVAVPTKIGETGFEPATARPPAGCATRLRHSPWLCAEPTPWSAQSGRRELNPPLKLGRLSCNHNTSPAYQTAILPAFSACLPGLCRHRPRNNGLINPRAPLSAPPPGPPPTPPPTPEAARARTSCRAPRRASPWTR